MASANNIPPWKLEYEPVEITHWEVPPVNDVRLLGQPTIPQPLHSCNPRSLLGNKWWNSERKHCYQRAHYKCEVCGHQGTRGEGDYNAHELYDIDYENHRDRYIRTVCLCPACHEGFIHCGRQLSLYKHRNPLVTREGILRNAEHGFKLIDEYNKTHDDIIRVNDTWLDYLKEPTLKEDMLALFKKYNIKFYYAKPEHMRGRVWGEWRLVIGGREYEPIYKTKDDWRERFDASHDTIYNYKSNLTGGVFDEVDKILGTYKEPTPEDTEKNKVIAEMLKGKNESN